MFGGNWTNGSGAGCFSFGAASGEAMYLGARLVNIPVYQKERERKKMENKFYNGIIGLVVADAVGVPVEFRDRDTYEVTEMRGYGTYNQPPGTWSDDSSMTLATVESIGRLEKIDPVDIMNNFVMWLEHAAFTPHDEVFDVGGATRRAISRYNNGTPIFHCGGKSRMDNGNGALMRILPVAMAAKAEKPDKKILTVKCIAGLTHDHPISHIACFIYSFMVENLMNGVDKREALSNAIQVVGKLYNCSEAWQEYRFLPEIGKYDRDEIKSSGYVVDTLEAAIWCLMNSSSYKDCILLAVNLGGDTDTVAAVAGGLAGILYGCGGESGVPDEWIAQVARKDWIKGLCDEFENKLSK